MRLRRVPQDKLALVANQNIKEREFWVNKLSGDPLKSNFPFDYKKNTPYQRRMRMTDITFKFPRKIFSQFMELSKNSDHTLNAVLTAGLVVLLNKYTNTNDIIIGTPIYKQHIDTEFINTLLVLRIRFEENATFKHILLLVSQTIMEATKHYNYPIELLPGKLNIPVSEEEFALFDIVILLRNIHDKSYIEHISPHIIFSFLRTDSDVEGCVEFDSSLFNKKTIERIIKHFIHLFQSALFNIDLHLPGIEILSEEETRQLLIDFNKTEVSYPGDKTLHRLFEEQVESTQDNIALHGCMIAWLHGEDVSITYRELNQNSDQLAYLLREKGVKPDIIVGIMVERSVEMMVGILGILKAGGHYLPIDPGYPEDRITFMLTDSSTGILLTTRNLSGKTTFDKEIIYLEDSYELTASIKQRSTRPWPGILKNQQPTASLAYVIYTSGSTGKPKGTAVSHSNVNNYTIWFKREFEITGEDKFCFTGSFCFDMSVTSLIVPLISGASIYTVMDKIEREPQLYTHYLAKNKISIIKLTPTQFRSLLDFIQEEGTRSLRNIILGGEAVDGNDVLKYLTFYRSQNVVNEYGPTEATVASVFHVVSGDTARRKPSGTGIEGEKTMTQVDSNVPIGRPIFNTQVYILDKYLKIVPIGVPGELCIGGNGLSRGYLNNPELTAERFVNDYCLMTNDPAVQGIYKKWPFHSPIYKTGDLAHRHPDGNIEYLGRIDQQVKIRGFRIEPGEIESKLVQHQEIKEAVAMARNDEKGDRYICAYITYPGTSGKPPDTSALREYLAHMLPDYMIPAFFVQLEKIPLTPNGKIDRKALPEPGIEAEGPYTAPRDALENKLQDIWFHVLQVDRDKIGIDSNFFRLGGHSLKATIMTSMIHKELNVKVSLEQIFKKQTIRKLSEYINNAQEYTYIGIDAIEKKEYYDLSSAQKRLYFLQQVDLNSASYNISNILSLGKRMDKNKLEVTLKQLIARHESLRTSFERVNENPVQRVYDQVEFQAEYYEAASNDRDDRETGTGKGKDIQSLIDNFIRPFDLARVPLVRSGVIKTLDGQYIWIVDVHHIVSDGTSQMILTEDFLTLYNGMGMEPLRLHYKDFSHWQNRLFEGGYIKDQEDYWLELFAGEIPRLEFPADYKRPEVFTFEGDTYSFMLGREDALKFRTLASRNGATLYMNILAALDTLFYKYTGQTDITIGTGIAGRHHADLQHIIGMFVNTLAMRNYPDGEKTYESFLEEVVINSVKAFENQDVQFEELVDKLDLERDTSRNPLFDISIVLQNFRRPGEGAPGEDDGQEPVQIEVVPSADEDLPAVDYRNPTAKFDLTFFVHELQDDVFVTLEYYTGIFKPETSQRLAAHFKNLVKVVAEQPSIKLKDIEIIFEEEKKQLLHEWNGTAQLYPHDKTLHELFEGQVERTPDNISVVSREQGAGVVSITYRELEKKANQLANYLYFKMEKHTRQEDRVGIFMDKTIDLIAVVLGILKSGGAYVPLDPTAPEGRIKTIINDGGIGIVIFQKKYVKILNRLQWECPCFHTFLCMDSTHILLEEEEEINELMSEELWDYVGETAVDDITGGGWMSSYTGKPMTREEMDEYGNNILKKLEPLLHPRMRVLEIGTASGISMYRIAPKVDFYHGTDLSRVIIEKNREIIEKEGHQNIKLSCLAAHEIDKIGEKEFDLVIMNSVIQSFHGHHYLRKVIHKAIGLLGEKGHLFIGDVMDQEKKDALIRDMLAFKYDEANRDKGYTTKTDFSSELFLSRDFWKDLGLEVKEIESIRFSDKIYTIENELARFRYDVLITIDWQSVSGKLWKKRKYQEDIGHLTAFGSEKVPLQASSGNLAYIIYTSGTTGRPKGVIVEHYSVANLVFSQARHFKIDEKDRILQFSSICFDASVEQIFMALSCGAPLVMIGKDILLDNDKFPGFVSKQSITHIHAVPTFFNNINLEGNDQLKRIIAGGDVCPVPLAKRLSRYCDFYNEYGPTETTVTSIEMKFSPVDVDGTLPRLSIGKPIDNTFVYMLDRGMRLVPQGAVGELYIGGAGVARGYLNLPELTSERFVDFTHSIIYKTGDLARWLPEGNIEFLGRIDNQIKIRGFRIELKEIENQLLNHKEIKEAVVLVKGEESGDKYLFAFIVPDSVRVEELKEYLSRCLPEYMVPAYFLALEKLPLTPGGKVDRKALLSYKESRAGLSSDYAVPGTYMEKLVINTWKEVLQLETIGIHDNFFEIGGNSINILRVQGKLKKILEKDIPVVKLFRYPTIHSLALYLDKGEDDKNTFEKELKFSEEITIGKDRLKERTENPGLGEMETMRTGLEVAVIGMAGRFPGAQNIKEFWNNLKNSVESITFFSDEDLEEAGSDHNLIKNANFVKANGIMEDMEYFDASFFDFTPNEAAIMDPQVRIFHQCVWAALEVAGYDPSSYPRRIGLYAGSSPNILWEMLTMFSGAGGALSGLHSIQLRDKDFMCTRISYKLNLKGPSFSVQTACSTSLVAVHLAVQGLLNGECEMALAGGVTISYPQSTGYLYQEGMVESPDGHCRAFDAGSNGTVAGNGAAVVVLKRFKEAAADRDNIYAIIKGSAINNDGTRKVGYYAPSVEGQAEVIRAAHYMAGVEPESITYVEAHGTGTQLGDPVEVEALKMAFNTHTHKKRFCGIGSVKTNIGHLDTAAGVAGLIKTALALKYRLIPPSLHFKNPNPKLGLENSPFYVVSKLTKWKSRENGYPLRAGISSLGIGGTNAHVVLEEAPYPWNESVDSFSKYSKSACPSRPYQMILLSARTKAALEKAVVKLVEYLKENPEVNLADVAYTLQVGRQAFEYRKMDVCTDVNDAVEKLSSPPPGKSPGFFCPRDSGRSVVFLFPGQGSQYVDMGLELYQREKTFQEQMDQCFDILEPIMGYDLKEIFYPDDSVSEVSRDKINQTEIAQPVIFAIEYALAKLLSKWEIKPYAMIGHSIGEYVAACLSGVFSLEDALTLVAFRGQLMRQLPTGAMLSIALPEEKLTPLLESNEEISLAAVNSSSLCVVSGTREAVRDFGEEMSKNGYKIRLLHTSHAFHSKMMDPILKKFEKKVKSITLNKPRVPYISNVSGSWIRGEEAVDPAYWASHLRRTVRFSRGLEILLKESGSIFVEVGPGRTLRAFVKQHKKKKNNQKVVNLVRHPQESVPDDYFAAQAMGQLWLYGVQIDWHGFYSGEERYRIPLPTYPFEKKYFYFDENIFKEIRKYLHSPVNEKSTGDIRDLFSVSMFGVESGHEQSPEIVPGEYEKEYEAPRNELEETITQVWQEVLGFERISIHSNFFDIHGDSLIATQLVNRLNQVYAVEISLKRFFEEPTIAYLAEVIKELLVEKVKSLSEEELEKLAGQ